MDTDKLAVCSSRGWFTAVWQQNIFVISRVKVAEVGPAGATNGDRLPGPMVSDSSAQQASKLDQ